MACAQACRNAESYECRHKAVVAQMCNEAQYVASQHGCAMSVVTGACIKNLTKGDFVSFLDKKDWAGSSKAMYPHKIAKLHSGTFAHKSNCKCSSDKAAVVYSDNCGNAWLLAWSVTANCNVINKVHVEAGAIENYVGLDWDEIEARLDDSCDTSHYVDQTTGCEIFGKISKGKKAALVVSFHSYN